MERTPRKARPVPSLRSVRPPDEGVKARHRLLLHNLVAFCGALQQYITYQAVHYYLEFDLLNKFWPVSELKRLSGDTGMTD